LYKNGGHAAKSGFGPPYESAELFQHLSHALMPVICPTGQVFVFAAMPNDVV